MVVAESIVSKIWLTSRVKVVAVFFLAGLVSGIVSAWLSSTPGLQRFLYTKGDKFLIPTYKFWTGFALLFSAALVTAFLVSRRCGWLTLSPSVLRQSLALVVVVTSPLVLYLSTDLFFALAPTY